MTKVSEGQGETISRLRELLSHFGTGFVMPLFAFG
jgi:hypothetical protein